MSQQVTGHFTTSSEHKPASASETAAHTTDSSWVCSSLGQELFSCCKPTSCRLVWLSSRHHPMPASRHCNIRHYLIRQCRISRAISCTHILLLTYAHLQSS